MKTVFGLGLLAAFLGVTLGTSCPDRWIAFQGSCYLIGHSTKYNFLEAEVFCRQTRDGAHLVHVDSMKESVFLKDEFRAYKNASFWSGLSDMAVEGTWVWYDSGKPAKFTDWFPGDPNSYMGQDEDCVLFWEISNYEWVDAPCSTQAEPVCELVLVRKDVDGRANSWSVVDQNCVRLQP